MNIADVFVLPSVSEPFGLVVLEALGCGCRVVSTKVGGPPFFIPADLRREGLAMLVEPIKLTEVGDVDTNDIQPFVSRLQGAISRMLKNDVPTKERSKISKTVEHMTWGNIYQRINRVYVELIKEGLTNAISY